MLGVFLDVDTVDRGDLEWSGLRDCLPEWRFYRTADAATTQERLADAVVAVSNKVVLDEATLREMPQLRLVCVAATGVNNVDLEAARRARIVVCNARGYATPAVVQHVFALILALAGSLFGYRDAVAGGRWRESPHFCLLDFPIMELAGRTIGIVGYGELGLAVGRLAEAFGMRVLIAQRPGGSERAGRIPLEELLPQVDVLTLHCPLTPETRGLIGGRELKSMRSGAILINTARGGIVDEAALAAALTEGKIAGAGVDVLSREPPVGGNPLLGPGVPNLIVTPHVAWASRESRQRLIDQVVDNIQAFKQGKPRNVV